MVGSSGSGSHTTSTDRGYLMLDYHWQRHMGDLHFNKDAFPDINETLKLVR